VSMRQKPVSRLKVVLTENLLPNSAEPGTVFFTKDRDEAWMATVSGRLLCLHDLFSGSSDRIIRGLDGKDGATGPQGPPGDVLTPTDADVAAAVVALRTQKSKIKASFVEAMLSTKSGKKVQVHLRLLLANIKRDCGLE
jgi:hypothetical protein